MKKIYYLQKHPVKIGDVIDHNGFKAIVTEELIKFNPELFVVEDSMRGSDNYYFDGLCDVCTDCGYWTR